MAFTVSDIDDLVRLLAEHPEWRARLRPLILGDEMLQIPTHMDRVEAALERSTERMDRIEAALGNLTAAADRSTERMDRIEATLEAVGRRVQDLTAAADRSTERMDRIEATIEHLTAAADRSTERMDRIEATIEHLSQEISRLAAAILDLTRRSDRTDGELGNIRGDLLEMKFDRNIGNWLRTWMRKPRKVEMDDLDLLDSAVSQGSVTEQEAAQVAALDAVVQGRDRVTMAEFMLAIEISQTINVDDVDRANRRAEILRRAGYDVLPFVLGYRITDQAADYAHGVGAIVSLLRPAA